VAYLRLVRCMASKDSPGCLVLVASLLIVIATSGLIRSVLALLHHEAFYWLRVRAFIPTWFNPWQGIVSFSLILAFAVYILILAIRQLRK
jgi:hypothetical protein